MSNQSNIIGFLSGEDIRENELIESGIEVNYKSCSYDLRIGEIIFKEKKIFSREKVEETRHCKVLRPGENALIITKEKVTLKPNIGAVVFPPNRISKDGLLILNQGHIDPLTQHKLTAVVINMSKSDFTLEPGSSILTALFFKTTKEAKRGPDILPDEQRKEELKNSFDDKMPRDFLNISSRIIGEVRNKILTIGVMGVLITILVGFMGIFLPFFMNFSSEYFQKHFNKIDKIEERVSNLEGKIEILYKEGENLGENRKKISNQKDEKK